MSGLLIAGISGAGKTTLFRRIAPRLSGAGNEIFSSFPQAMTTTAHLHLGSDPTNQARTILEWADRLLCFWERLNSQALVLRDEPYAGNWVPMLLLEGFVFDIPLHDLAIKRQDVLPLEQRLANLGVRAAVLAVAPEQIKQQCVESTRQHRGNGWFEHLEKLGGDDEERAAHFQRQQSLLLEWARTSPLPHTVVHTDEQDWEGYAAKLCQLAG